MKSCSVDFNAPRLNTAVVISHPTVMMVGSRERAREPGSGTKFNRSCHSPSQRLTTPIVTHYSIHSKKPQQGHVTVSHFRIKNYAIQMEAGARTPKSSFSDLDRGNRPFKPKFSSGENKQLPFYITKLRLNSILHSIPVKYRSYLRVAVPSTRLNSELSILLKTVEEQPVGSQV